MASTFTPNIQLEEPARGDDVGTWDTPVNNNMSLVDLVVGGIATISLNNSPVVLSAAQFQARQITFNSTLTGSVAITFPTSFTKSYDIQNMCSGSSAFVITLLTTAAGGQAICCPAGETVECFNDGSNIKFRNLGRVGSYMDWAGSSVPAWITGCSIPPYLNCDASAFSSAVYPVLAVVLGSNTLPDIRGVSRATLNQGTGRITTGGGGLDGNTNYSVGGAQQVTLTPGQIPLLTSRTSSPLADSFPTNIPGSIEVPTETGSGHFAPLWGPAAGIQISHGMVTSNTGGQPHFNVQPTTISGLCLIRAG